MQDDDGWKYVRRLNRSVVEMEECGKDEKSVSEYMFVSRVRVVLVVVVSMSIVNVVVSSWMCGGDGCGGDCGCYVASRLRLRLCVMMCEEKVRKRNRNRCRYMIASYQRTQCQTVIKKKHEICTVHADMQRIINVTQFNE